jgi:hypothetical protein
MRLKNVLLLAAIVGVVAWYSKKQEAQDLVRPHDAQSEPLLVERSETFRCEGKTRCSQMSSCEEATFYLQHCPGTEMDGDKDGVPCESQHCGSQ